MKSALRYALCTFALLAGAMMLSHSTARAAGCTINSPASFPDLVNNYDVFSGPSVVHTVSSPAIKVMCMGENNKTINLYVSGSPTGYTTPSLTNTTAGFTLQYTLCVPGTTGGCSPTVNAWTMSTPYSFVSTSGNVTVTLPAFSIYIAQQDAPVGDTTKYTGSLYFSINCGNSPAAAWSSAFAC